MFPQVAVIICTMIHLTANGCPVVPRPRTWSGSSLANGPELDHHADVYDVVFVEAALIASYYETLTLDTTRAEKQLREEAHLIIQAARSLN
jgi:hypothetical protein